MRRKTLPVAAISSWLMLAANLTVAGDDESGAQLAANSVHSAHGIGIKQQSLSHGDLSILVDNLGIPVPVTDLVNCSALPLPVVLRIRGTFDFYDGICDDSAEPRCDAKLIYRSELCLGEFLAQSELVGRISSDFGRAKTRICYDQDGDGECLASEKVAGGFVTIQDQGFVIDGEIQAPAREIAVRTITKSRPFHFNHKRVRIRRNGTLVNILLDLPPGFPETPITPQTCLGDACGFAASGVSIGR